MGRAETKFMNQSSCVVLRILATLTTLDSRWHSVTVATRVVHSLLSLFSPDPCHTSCGWQGLVILGNSACTATWMGPENMRWSKISWAQWDQSWMVPLISNVTKFMKLLITALTRQMAGVSYDHVRVLSPVLTHTLDLCFVCLIYITSGSQKTRKTLLGVC